MEVPEGIRKCIVEIFVVGERIGVRVLLISDINIIVD